MLRQFEEPAVVGLQPWRSVEAVISGKHFRNAGTPCKHFPGGEVRGFVVESESFGVSNDGLPNVVYFSGDTVWIDELARIREKWHIAVAVLNMGNALFPTPKGMVQITFNGQQAAHLMRVFGVDAMAPIHFQSWEYFTEHQADLRRVLEEEEVNERVHWLKPGVKTKDL
ncbi:hypothetical protein BP00DRAFT_334708 [Aspergillus indologenus CBS 114.80]|uniref:Metallo-beta-lactamase domain-containing protein n=1 Tax=Aspergillus indologenus CBS 114.80 TaxID=1450541 RepID=A0A2V5J126_9EURO|nr:hypothetical protein BP00DRAFT_334708 [Aspergillus indologenus CBS 114.80]